jgi:hypothetical protein
LEEIRITSKKELEAWLRDKPREWAIAIAARAALRVVPLWDKFLTSKGSSKETDAEDFILTLFRSVAVPRLSALKLNRDMRAAAAEAAATAAATDNVAATQWSPAAAARWSEATTAARWSATAAADAAAAADDDARWSAAAVARWSTDAVAAARWTATAVAAWDSISADATALAGGVSGAMTGPLWRTVDLGADGAVSVVTVDVPDWAISPLAQLNKDLQARSLYWSIWLDWYDAVLHGKQPWGLPHEAGNDVMYQLLTMNQVEWKKGAKYINPVLTAWVHKAWDREVAGQPELPPLEVIPSRETEPPAIPKPEIGPQIQFENDCLTLQHQPRIEAADDIAAQKKLHARLQKLLPTLAAETNKVGNIHPGLAFIVGEYAELIKPDYDQLEDFDIWAVGAGLIASAAAFARPGLLPQLTPTLEPSHLVLLSQAAQIHSGFILGQPAGRAMIDRADEMALNDEQFAVIGPEMLSILGLWQNKTDGVEETTRRLIGSVREAMIVSGWKAGRTGFVGYSLTRNGLIAIGRALSFSNSAGSTIVGGWALNEVDPGLVQTQVWLRFMSQNSQQIMQFVAPFPEMRAWFGWFFEQMEKDRGAH